MPVTDSKEYSLNHSLHIIIQQTLNWAGDAGRRWSGWWAHKGQDRHARIQGGKVFGNKNTLVEDIFSSRKHSQNLIYRIHFGYGKVDKHGGKSSISLLKCCHVFA